MSLVNTCSFNSRKRGNQDNELLVALVPCLVSLVALGPCLMSLANTCSLTAESNTSYWLHWTHALISLANICTFNCREQDNELLVALGPCVVSLANTCSFNSRSYIIKTTSCWLHFGPCLVSLANTCSFNSRKLGNKDELLAALWPMSCLAGEENKSV